MHMFGMYTYAYVLSILRVSIDISIGGTQLGRIEFRLYEDVPKTAANFRYDWNVALCYMYSYYIEHYVQVKKE